MTFIIYTVSFKTIQSTFFSKWRLLIFSDGSHTPLPAIFDNLPNPLKAGTPDFFHQKDRKECILDYLDGLLHIVLVLG